MCGCSAQKADAYTNAMHCIETSDYATASSLLGKAVSEGADRKLVYRAEGLAYLGKGDYASAAGSFENALAQSNGIISDVDIDISYYMTVAYYKAGRIQDALDTLDAVIALKPQYDTAYYLRGKINLIGGNKDGAIEDYNKAIELAPTNYDHYIRICEDLRDHGYTSESNEYIERAMASGGKMSSYRKGVFEYYLGSYTDARNDLENARKSEKNDNLLLYLGRCYEALGDNGYALNIYEEALTTNQSNGRIYNEVALLKIRQRDYRGALEVIDQALTQSDGEGIQNLMYNRIVACEHMYDFKKAAEYMKEYLSAYPDDANAQREYIFLKSR